MSFRFLRASTRALCVVAAWLCLPLPIALAGTLYTAEMDGSQCVPPTNSHATGHADLYLSDDQTNLHIQIRIWNLEGHMTACHIHQGAPGQYGSQLFNIPVFTDTTWADWSITDYGLRNLRAGDLFINVHTEENPNGEIRGQIYPGSSLSLTAHLTGSEVVPPTPSSGVGLADLTLWADGSRLHVELTAGGLTGAPLGSQIDRAPLGQNGPLVWDLGIPEGRLSRDIVPTGQQVTDLMQQQDCAIVLTQSFPAGEIRGQIGNSTAAVPGRPGASTADRTGDTAGGLDLTAVPNPAPRGATLRFRLPAPGAVEVAIFDAGGRVVRRLMPGNLPAGTMTLTWDGRSDSGVPAAAGTYLAQLTARGPGSRIRQESLKLTVSW